MRLLFIVLAVGLASPAFAQGQIFDFALRKLQQQIDKEQQRKTQRQQNQQNESNWQLFNEMWQDCFQRQLKQRCIDALAYPNISDADAAKLREGYRNIEATEDRNRRIEEFREQEAARQRAADERAERERQAEEYRQRERERLARQQDEENRLREARRLEQQREDEYRRQAAEYRSAVDDCRRYVYVRCNTALASPRLTSQDEPDLRLWRSTADTYGNDKQACRAADAAACNRALASPAVDDHEQLKGWRAAASIYYRALGHYENGRDTALAYTSAFFQSSKTLAWHAWAALRDLPTSTHVTGGVAALSLLVAGIALRSNRSRGAAPGNPPVEPRAEPTLSASAEQAPVPPPIQHEAGSRPEIAPPPVPIPGSNLPAIIKSEPVAVTIDTPAAVRAMALAHAYLAECEPSFEPGADNRPHRTTLALAARQLDIAERADPNAAYEDTNGGTWRLHELRSRVLMKEAMTHASDNIGKACTIAETASAHDPDSAFAHYTAGWLNYEHKNRDAAVAHLTRAVELDPDDIKSRMLLDRAQNMTAAEIATYKTQHAGITVANAGVKVYNTGVGIYNVGVFFWNILVYTLRVITFPIRVMDRIFNFVFR